MRFLKVNVNPHNKKTGDCATRAVCQACNIPYEDAAKELFDEWMATGIEMTHPKVFEAVLSRHGFEKHGKPFKSDGKTFSVEELVDHVNQGYKEPKILVVQVANHWTVVKGDKLIDLWDCSMKSVYGYYEKNVLHEELRVYGGLIKESKEAKGRRVTL